MTFTTSIREEFLTSKYYIKEDVIFHQVFPKIPMLAEDINSEYFDLDFLRNFSHLFVREVRESTINPINWDEFCFYLKPNLFYKIKNEMHNKFIRLENDNNKLYIDQIIYKLGNESQQQDLMTNCTVFCWFDILRNCEQMIELTKKSLPMPKGENNG